jgi:hypothetical protein
MNSGLTIETAGQATFGPCECCGTMTQRVWGYAYKDDAALAAYFVEWTPRHEAHSATFDLIVGPWGERTQPSDRQAVSLDFRTFDGGPSFMVVDANQRMDRSNLASQALTREQVIGTGLAPTVFGICDAIWLNDPRTGELRAP